jgi:hypothetical protein
MQVDKQKRPSRACPARPFGLAHNLSAMTSEVKQGG